MFDFKRKVNLSPERYTERIELYKYSITFAAAAVAFLVTAREKLNVSIDARSLKILLASWGWLSLLVLLCTSSHIEKSGITDCYLTKKEIRGQKRLNCF
jgi:hypothetical protein